MQQLVWNQTNVSGPAKLAFPLPPLRTVNHFVRDIATLAFPSDDPATGYRIELHRAKSGLGRGRFPSSLPTNVPRSAMVYTQAVVNLTSQVDPQGRLVWEVPAGRWTILRFGYTPLGTTNHPPSPGGSGLECDKLSSKAIETHFAAFLGKLINDVHQSDAFVGTHIDSWEVGFQNWTPNFSAEFRARRGYDLTPFLPCYAGRFVETPEISERFFWDVRRTIADLLADKYAQGLASLAAERGLQLSIEAYANGPFDQLQYAARATIPMAEFWTEREDNSRWHTCRTMASAAHTSGKTVIAAEAFTSHPADSRWDNHPFSLKSLADVALCEGINRLVFHCFAHQPWLDLKPGMTMGPFGVHYDRTETWWEESKTWHTYLARCQALLQLGTFTADLCYLTPEGAFTDAPTRQQLDPPLPQGYSYDCASPEVLDRMSVKGGRILLPDGMSYAILVLPPVDRMTPRFLRRVRDIVSAGATTVGPRPAKSPSLSGFPAGDSEVAQLAQELWADCDGRRIKEHKFGLGKIIQGKLLSEALNQAGLPPDFEALAPVASDPLRYIHRKHGDADIYFVVNSNTLACNVECAFRVSGKLPEFWHPDSGTTEIPSRFRQQDGRTVLDLKLDGSGSIFVIFRKASADFDPIVALTRDAHTDLTTAISALPDGTHQLLSFDSGQFEATTRFGRKMRTQVAPLPSPVDLSTNWTLAFPPNSGAPQSVVLDKLGSLSHHADPGVKYFSGRAVYNRSLALAGRFFAPDQRLFLNLGDVQVIAEVKINGREFGILWKPPFELDVTDALQPGDNVIEIAVVNLWPNRLIGDEQLPEDCRWQVAPSGFLGGLSEWPRWLLEGKPRTSGRVTFATWKHWEKTSALPKSGLLGPVRLSAAKRLVLKE
jgi:hypothetical protein